MNLEQRTEFGIGPATSLRKIWKMWSLLKSTNLLDKCSIRVFDGHLYSLIDDEHYYEGSGNRRLVNVLLYEWDHIRNLALKNEHDQNDRIMQRTEQEQATIDKHCLEFGVNLYTLIRRKA